MSGLMLEHLMVFKARQQSPLLDIHMKLLCNRPS